MSSLSKLESIFFAALEMGPGQDRAAFLDNECSGDADLRQRVEKMLAAQAGAGSFLEAPPSAVAVDPDPTIAGVIAERPGTQIGPYKLLQVIGEGGMGVVYMAEQSEPVERRVALKIIKPGMDSRQVIARFEAERQALALMDHQNIAKVFEAGTTDSGRPYFVMELVKGIPITRYCDEKRLSVKERLELTIPVCQAIQHAHQKGIIHRDIKPTNILVAQYDGHPVPKVIDFGVAKATAQKLTERTMFTELGQIVGTLEYMSPEQAELNQLDVDTRSDIYSLGVLLYELLTGSTPFDKQKLRTAAFHEMLRIIREEEPPKPSTKLSTVDTLASIAAVRGTEPARLSKAIRGELDWIVMKALEKDRNRRYETASSFAADLQRYLADEPVQACPPSATYRLRKFVRRNKGPLLAMTLVLLTLIGGVIGTTWGMVRAERARQAEAERAKGELRAKLDAQAARNREAERAEGEKKARQEAQAAAEAEKKAKEQAQKRLTQFTKGYMILEAVFANLDPRARVNEGRPLQAILGDQLTKAGEQLEGEAIGDPLMVARLQNRLGRSLLNLGIADQAIPLFVKAHATRAASLSADHPLTLESMQDLARAYHAAGKLDQALPLYEDCFKRMKEKLGADHLFTFSAMANLASGYKDVGKLDQAVALNEQVLTLMKANLTTDYPDMLTTMNNLAIDYQAVGKLDQALPLYEETFKLRIARLGADHPDTLQSMDNLAMGYRAAGKLDLALPLLEECFRLTKEKLGADHPNTLGVTRNLAVAYQAAGKLDLALPLLVETFKLTKAKLGADHPGTLNSMSSLALGYRAAGKLDLALPIFEETLKRQRAILGADHPGTLNSMNNLALGYQATQKLDLALPLFEEALKLQKAKLGADHPHTLNTMHNLALGYQAARKLDQALPLFEEAFQLQKAKLGADHPDTLRSMYSVARGLQDVGKRDLALPLLEECLKLTKAKLGADHPDTLTRMSSLAAAYFVAGKPDQALPLDQEAAIGIEKRRFQHEHAGLIVSNLAVCYERLKEFDQAEAWRRKWLAVVKERAGADSLPYADELAKLGSNLLKQQKWTDAEGVLRECLALREKQADEWMMFRTKSMLGAALVGQQKYADAEPLLVESYERVRQREAKAWSSRKSDRTLALERIVQLYDGWEKKVQADQWRKKLEALQTNASEVKNPQPAKKPN